MPCHSSEDLPSSVTESNMNSLMCFTGQRRIMQTENAALCVVLREELVFLTRRADESMKSLFLLSRPDWSRWGLWVRVGC